MSTELVPHEDADVGNALTVAAPFTLTRVGLVVDGPMTFDQWERAGQNLMALGTATQWSLGDWVLAGEDAFGEMASQAYDLTKRSYQSVANAASVCRRFPLSRRRETVSFSHHEAVAALPPETGDALLDAAEREGWSAHDLRERVREMKGTAKVPTAIDAFAAALRGASKALDQCDERTQLAAADHMAALLRLVAPSSRRSVDTDPKPLREMSPTPSTDDVKDASVDLEAPILAYVQSAATCKCKVRVRDIARQPEMAALLPKTTTRAYAIVRSTLNVLARRGLVRRDGEWWTLAVASSAMAAPTGIDDVISI